MMKTILGALAAVMIVGAVTASPAEARCWWNGVAWHCWHPHHNWYWHNYTWDHRW